MKKSERLKSKIKIKFKYFILANILTLFFVLAPASPAGGPIALAADNTFDADQKSAYSKTFSKLVEFLNEKKDELEKYGGSFKSVKAFLRNNTSSLPAEPDRRRGEEASGANYIAELDSGANRSFLSYIIESAKKFVKAETRFQLYDSFLSSAIFSVKDFFETAIGAVKNFVFPGNSQNSFEYQSSVSSPAAAGEEMAQEIEALKRQYAEAIDETNAISQKFNLLQNELGKIKNSGAVASQPSADQRALESTIGIIEKIVSGPSALSGFSQSDLDSKISEIRTELDNLNTSLTSQINNLSSNTNRQTASAFQAISLTNRIDNLSGTRLSNITVSGVSGLADADIPDTITASSYLPLAGGTLTGTLTGTSASFSSTLTVSASTTLNGVEYKWPSADGTANQALVTNSAGGLSWTTIISSSGVPDWNKQTNYGVLTLTPTTTIPVWAKDAIYASSTLTVQGASTFGNASTSLLTVSSGAWFTGGNIGLGTTSPYAKLSVVGETVAKYFTATSTTATSTFNGDINFGITSNILQGGQRFLTSSTTAAGNLTIGYQSATGLDANGGLYNTGVGYQVLKGLSGTSNASYNTAVGYQSLYSRDTGSKNTANGYMSLYSNSGGEGNTANGYMSLYTNYAGHYNTATGYESLASNETGSYNTANGYQTLYSNTGHYNTATGYESLRSNSIGWYNTANGYFSFRSNTTGAGNIGLGFFSGYGDGTTVDQRSVIDNYATFIGYQASRDASVLNTTALTNITAIGKNARVGASNTIVLGGTGSDAINVAIGTTSPWAKLSIQNTYGSQLPLFDIASSTSAAYATSSVFRVNANGNVGIGTTSPWKTFSVNGTVGFSSSLSATTTNANDVCIDVVTFEITRRTTDCSGASSLRYKQNVEKLSYGLEDLMKLNPVSFQYTEAFAPTDRTRKIGFIAEEIALLIPEVVAYDDLGRPDSLDYPKITSLLAKAIQELNIKVSDLQTNAAVLNGQRDNSLFSWIVNKFMTTMGIVFEQDRIKAKNICVGETCVTEEQFKSVFGAAQSASSANSQSSIFSASSSSSSESSSISSQAPDVQNSSTSSADSSSSFSSESSSSQSSASSETSSQSSQAESSSESSQSSASSESAI